MNMAQRTTEKQLRERVEQLALRGIDISIGWAYGRPRITNQAGSRDLSPRLATGEMATWLDGFETALNMNRRWREGDYRLALRSMNAANQE
jgi:hypothetical protein